MAISLGSGSISALKLGSTTVTNLTVYARVNRISTSQATITFGTTPANDVRVLIHKIG